MNLVSFLRLLSLDVDVRVQPERLLGRNPKGSWVEGELSNVRKPIISKLHRLLFQDGRRILRRLVFRHVEPPIGNDLSILQRHTLLLEPSGAVRVISLTMHQRWVHRLIELDGFQSWTVIGIRGHVAGEHRVRVEHDVLHVWAKSLLMILEAVHLMVAFWRCQREASIELSDLLITCLDLEINAFELTSSALVCPVSGRSGSFFVLF